jgi:hypothetical protein
VALSGKLIPHSSECFFGHDIAEGCAEVARPQCLQPRLSACCQDAEELRQMTGRVVAVSIRTPRPHPTVRESGLLTAHADADELVPDPKRLLVAQVVDLLACDLRGVSEGGDDATACFKTVRRYAGLSPKRELPSVQKMRLVREGKATQDVGPQKNRGVGFRQRGAASTRSVRSDVTARSRTGLVSGV